jgi:zinc transport system substrate-binding protein
MLGLVIALLAAASPAWADIPRVLVSIKPLHGLVAAVMQGVAEPRLLVGGNQSPHGYAFKPSDMRPLEQAQLVVWVGPDFETWLVQRVARAPASLAMEEVPAMTRLATREGGVWEAHDDHAGHDDHDHGEVDGHLWLDAENASRLVKAVAEKLAALDPAHAAQYAANAVREVARIEALDRDINRLLTPLAKKPYVVFHDAHQYFERRYGLNPAGAITVDPERQPGPKRLAALRGRLKAQGAACVFREPNAQGPVIQSLAEATGARIGMLDPEGLLVTPGPDAYEAILRGIADGLADCLSRP